MLATGYADNGHSPKYADADSDAGRDAISQCLLSPSAAVVDQSVRELCRLVAAGRMEIPRGMLELQAALEGCEPRFAGLFVKGLGSLVHLGFPSNGLQWRFGSAESHPFVKVLLSRSEVQSEVVQQVLLLMADGKKLGMSGIYFGAGQGSCTLSEELLLTFPVICLLSSPSKSVKVAVIDLLIMLEKILVEKFVLSNNKPMIDDRFHLSTPGSIVFRLLHH